MEKQYDFPYGTQVKQIEFHNMYSEFSVKWFFFVLFDVFFPIQPDKKSEFILNHVYFLITIVINLIVSFADSMHWGRFTTVHRTVQFLCMTCKAFFTIICFIILKNYVFHFGAAIDFNLKYSFFSNN